MNYYKTIIALVFGVFLVSSVSAQDAKKVTIEGKPAVFTAEPASMVLDVEVPFKVDHTHAETFGPEYKKITLPVMIEDHELAQKLKEQREKSPVTFGSAYERKTMKIER